MSFDQVFMFDIVSISLIFILGIKGILNGFVKEVFGLVGVIGGIYLASRYAAEAGTLIDMHVFKFGNQSSLYLFGFIAILVIFWISALFLGHLIAHALKLSGLSMIDKLAGFAIGSLKIFFVFSIFAVTLNNIQFIKSRIEPFTQKSIMFPLFFEAGRYIVKIDTKHLIENAPNLSETNSQ